MATGPPKWTFFLRATEEKIHLSVRGPLSLSLSSETRCTKAAYIHYEQLTRLFPSTQSKNHPSKTQFCFPWRPYCLPRNLKWHRKDSFARQALQNHQALNKLTTKHHAVVLKYQSFHQFLPACNLWTAQGENLVLVSYCRATLELSKWWLDRKSVV